jgi:glycosyltransferase involved in cell wall biosynthesis
MKIVYLLEGTEISGGAKVVLDHASELARRGHAVTVAGRTPRPAWHSMEGVEFLQDADFSQLPEADWGIATFWTTVAPACDSGRFKRVAHFCQGYEGSFPPYQPIREQIDAAYARPVPKLLVSSHLQEVLAARFTAPTFVLGPYVDRARFCRPPAPPAPGPPFVISVVGPYEVELKGVKDALQGLLMAKKRIPLAVRHASTSPLSLEEVDLGCTDAFFHNLLPDQMAAFYQGCHFHVQASHAQEGFGLPAVEALACGVLPLVSDIPSFKGFRFPRFPQGDLQALVDLLLEIAGDPALYARRLKEAEACLEGIALKTVIDRLEAVLSAP